MIELHRSFEDSGVGGFRVNQLWLDEKIPGYKNIRRERKRNKNMSEGAKLRYVFRMKNIDKNLKREIKLTCSIASLANVRDVPKKKSGINYFAKQNEWFHKWPISKSNRDNEKVNSHARKARGGEPITSCSSERAWIVGGDVWLYLDDQGTYRYVR